LTIKKKSEKTQMNKKPTMAAIIAHCGIAPFVTFTEPHRGQTS
jgi:hypothetical protein